MGCPKRGHTEFGVFPPGSLGRLTPFRRAPKRRLAALFLPPALSRYFDDDRGDSDDEVSPDRIADWEMGVPRWGG